MRHLQPLIVLSIMACPPAGAFAADWPQFRGAARDGIASVESVPTEWSATRNVLWKAALPQAGNSSPVVVGNRVLVTCAGDEAGRTRGLLCFDATSGSPLWRRTESIDTTEPTHATNPYCAASPASDGERIVVWHATAGLFCYDLDGKPLWRRDLGPIRHIWGWASSPVIHGDRVYLNAGPGANQFVCAIDKTSGAVLWKTDEPGGAEDKSPQTKGWIGSWSTPRVVEVGGKVRLLVFMAGRVNAYDTDTGKIAWSIDGAGDLAYSDVYVTPPQADGSRLGVALAGYGGAAIGFRFDADRAERLWRDDQKHPQRIGTGVLLGDRLIVPNEPYVGCYDVATGKVLWREQIKGERFWGGIVRAGDALYLTSKAGTTHVFEADASAFKPVAQNKLGEASNSTPAVAGGRLYLRTAKHLWCIGAN